MPTVTVTAQKEPEDRQKVPVSVTAVTRETIDAAGIRLVSEAAILAPNTVFTECTARKLSNARFRGIGSSPNNPGITTYIDGVPQLNANSSSIELLDVDQIEFVRGPQSALFGRNTLGGLVNVDQQPAVDDGMDRRACRCRSATTAPGRCAAASRARSCSDKLAVGFSFAQVNRDGFTVNDVTGHDIDSRSAFSVKGQMLWTPDANWEARVIVTGERARDGDYGLNDVARAARQPVPRGARLRGPRQPRHLRHDHPGRAGPAGRSSSRAPPAFVKWKTQDLTDLDYTPRRSSTRDNTEEDLQFTQEMRVASAEQAPIRLSDSAPAALAGRRVLLHAGLRAGRGQQLLAVRRRARSRSRSTRRGRRSTTAASACSARAR